MSEQAPLTGTALRTPRAAAIAGILFSTLLMTALLLLWSAVPVDPREPGAWLAMSAGKVVFALNLVPFAGIAFLWFIGVLRDRLGTLEDRFFATVFLGSGLLFLAMLFVAAAALGAIIAAHAAMPVELIHSPAFALARSFAYNAMNLYALKMAGVFMMTTSTLAIRTGITARWLALLGFGLALVLLFGSSMLDLNFMVFPIWVLLISVYILADNLHRTKKGAAEASG